MATSQVAVRNKAVDIGSGDADYVNDPFDAIFVGGAGDVIFVDKAGNEETWPMAAGSYLLCGGVTIKDTSTATLMKALWNSP
jgi:hypothetical protein